MPPQGIALCIGVRRSHYAAHRCPPHARGLPARIPAVDEGAKRLAALATRRGFLAKVLVNSNRNDAAPTHPNVLRELAKAATELNETGGTLLLTFAGHGLLVPDDETAGARNAAWCLKDRPLTSHELTRALEQFNERVRLWILSDSCYSGAMVSSRGRPGPRPAPFEAAVGPERANHHPPSPPSFSAPPSGPPSSAAPPGPPSSAAPPSGPPSSAAPPSGPPSSAPPSIRAAVLFLSACKDDQRTRQGEVTHAFVDLWENDRYNDSYDDLCDAVVRNMTKPGTREPQKYWAGEGPAFGRQKPPIPEF